MKQFSNYLKSDNYIKPKKVLINKILNDIIQEWKISRWYYMKIHKNEKYVENLTQKNTRKWNSL